MVRYNSIRYNSFGIFALKSREQIFVYLTSDEDFPFYSLCERQLSTLRLDYNPSTYILLRKNDII